MIDLIELCDFLIIAKKATYAAGDAAMKTMEKDGSTTLIFERGSWRYHDNYFGGEPYGGREVVSFQGQSVYMMVYYGWVDEHVSNVSSVYKILQNALANIPEDRPFRGPKNYEENGFIYTNVYEGAVDNFFGEEIITSKDGQEMYRAKYIGGLIDLKK